MIAVLENAINLCLLLRGELDIILLEGFAHRQVCNKWALVSRCPNKIVNKIHTCVDLVDGSGSFKQVTLLFSLDVH